MIIPDIKLLYVRGCVCVFVCVCVCVFGGGGGLHRLGWWVTSEFYWDTTFQRIMISA